MAIWKNDAKHVEFEADCGAKSYLERVELVGPPATPTRKQCAVLYRYGSPVTKFMATAEQAKKITKRRGKIRITSKAIKDVSLWCRR